MAEKSDEWAPFFGKSSKSLAVIIYEHFMAINIDITAASLASVDSYGHILSAKHLVELLLPKCFHLSLVLQGAFG